jgi:hypothetical protein
MKVDGAIYRRKRFSETFLGEVVLSLVFLAVLYGACVAVLVAFAPVAAN